MIAKIRKFLAKKKLDALILSRTDSFLGEYYPPEKNQFQRATGFSGSAGLAVITQTQAVLFTDSRYTEQAKIETDFDVFEIPTQTTVAEWIKENLKGKVLGYNPWQRSVGWVFYMYKSLKNEKITLTGICESDWKNLFPDITKTQPSDYDYDEIYAGESVDDKIKRFSKKIKTLKLDGFIVTAPDNVSWLLNKRSDWVPEYPVIFKRLVVMSDKKYFFLNTANLSELSGKKIGIDLAITPQALYDCLNPITKLANHSDPIFQMKAVKNKIECKNIRQACLSESVVLCRFLAWVEQNKVKINELDCDGKLKSLRRLNPLYKGDSFDTIAAVGEHAARAHYRADKKTSVRVTTAPILLVDTGGNYLNGTTDMTRTVCTGRPTSLIKKRYTQVLKGHIALACTPIAVGQSPAILDKNARRFLRQDGVDYGHSTGHGIGMFLAVHENPPCIYEKTTEPLSAGMLFSNEPAYYNSEKGFGIRLENMILTRKGKNNSLTLENLIWVPFDYRLTDVKLLTQSEKEWLKKYHQNIRKKIFPFLTRNEQMTLAPMIDFFVDF